MGDGAMNVSFSLLADALVASVAVSVLELAPRILAYK